MRTVTLLFGKQCFTPVVLSGAHRAELVCFDIQMFNRLSLDEVRGKNLDKDESIKNTYGLKQLVEKHHITYCSQKPVRGFYC